MTAKTPKKLTYQVLDAINAGQNDISAMVKETGISLRTVNSLLYALEKQSRVIANDYQVKRSEQQFSVLRYEADPTKGSPRTHPTHRNLAPPRPTITMIHELPRGFFSIPSMRQAPSRNHAHA